MKCFDVVHTKLSYTTNNVKIWIRYMHMYFQMQSPVTFSCSFESITDHEQEWKVELGITKMNDLNIQV